MLDFHESHAPAARRHPAGGTAARPRAAGPLRRRGSFRASSTTSSRVAALRAAQEDGQHPRRRRPARDALRDPRAGDHGTGACRSSPSLILRSDTRPTGPMTEGDFHADLARLVDALTAAGPRQPNGRRRAKGKGRSSSRPAVVAGREVRSTGLCRRSSVLKPDPRPAPDGPAALRPEARSGPAGRRRCSTGTAAARIAADAADGHRRARAVTDAIQPTIGAPIGVEPRKTIAYSAMTRPRIAGSTATWIMRVGGRREDDAADAGRHQHHEHQGQGRRHGDRQHQHAQRRAGAEQQAPGGPGPAGGGQRADDGADPIAEVISPYVPPPPWNVWRASSGSSDWKLKLNVLTTPARQRQAQLRRRPGVAQAGAQLARVARQRRHGAERALHPPQRDQDGGERQRVGQEARRHAERGDRRGPRAPGRRCGPTRSGRCSGRSPAAAPRRRPARAGSLARRVVDRVDRPAHQHQA